MIARTVARVTYRGREYIVDQGQRTVTLRIPTDGVPILRRINWHGPTARGVRLRASHAAEMERIAE